MKINCESCGTFVAEVLPGSKIKKGAVMLCDKCEGARKVLNNLKRAGAKQNNGFGDIYNSFMNTFPKR